MTSSQISPNGTAGSSGLRLDGAATVHDALAGKGGYCYFETHGAYALLDYSTFTLPPGAVVLSATHRFTTQCLQPDGHLTLYRNGSSDRVDMGPYYYTPGWQYLTNTNSSNSGSYANFTQATIDNYQVFVQIYHPSSGPCNFVSIGLYVTIVYIGLPTISLAGMAGNYTVSTIPVSWTFAKNLDSPTGQSKYHIRVFTAAQYSIGGFDPATSPATYDTGVVASAASSVNVPFKFTGTYRVYVRAAHTNSGQDQWALWQYRGFSVTLPTLNYWSGTAFLPGSVRIWNGTGFVDAVNVRIWNGSAWLNSVGG